MAKTQGWYFFEDGTFFWTAGLSKQEKKIEIIEHGEILWFGQNGNDCPFINKTEINETFYVEEASYDMPYHELSDIVSFIRNHEWDELPESIKDNLEKWEEFLIYNL